MTNLQIIKIGGNIIDEDDNLHQFITDFASLPSAKILVHGGGKSASSLGKKLGIVPRMVDGRRITDEDTLNLVTMVYAGLINKNIVAKLQASGVNAWGLSGVDANVIRARKREVNQIDYGYAGDLDETSIDRQIIEQILGNNICPVFCAITHDRQGQLLNTNADTIATALAKAMKDHFNTTLIYCFEKNGVLKDADDENSLLQTLSWEEYQQYKTKKIIKDGMIPKLDNAFDALKSGVQSIQIKHARNIKNNLGTRLY